MPFDIELALLGHAAIHSNPNAPNQSAGENLTDILTNLRHWAGQHGLSWSDHNDCARDRFTRQCFDLPEPEDPEPFDEFTGPQVCS